MLKLRESEGRGETRSKKLMTYEIKDQGGRNEINWRTEGEE